MRCIPDTNIILVIDLISQNCSVRFSGWRWCSIFCRTVSIAALCILVPHVRKHAWTLKCRLLSNRLTYRLENQPRVYFPSTHLAPFSDKLQNSIIQIVTHVWQRLTFSHVNPFCVGLGLQPNGSKPDLLTVIRAGGRAIVSLPDRTRLRAWLKAVNTKLFKVNLQPPPLTEANQYTINVRLVRLSSKQSTGSPLLAEINCLRFNWEQQSMYNCICGTGLSVESKLESGLGRNYPPGTVMAANLAFILLPYK